MRIFQSKNIQGFTLIEMIVSLAVFSIVVTTAIGAMLVLISTNQQLQAEQNVITNLSFALDTMTREIRTGDKYYCANSGSGDDLKVFTEDQESIGTATKNCIVQSTYQYRGVSFFEGGESLTKDTTVASNRISYFYDFNQKAIFRRLGNETAQAITSSGLVITDMQFFVSGAVVGDDEQPTVTIYIEAKEKDDAEAKTYHLETTVTQRILDI